MKALRNIHGTSVKKGQVVTDGLISSERIPTLIKYGFIEADKPEPKKVKSESKDKKVSK